MNNLNLKSTAGEMPIIIKMRELYKIFYKYSILFPKNAKYTIGGKCENYILETLELLLAAGNAPKNEKLTLIRNSSVKFDALKFFIRIAREVNALDLQKYITLQKHLQEIGAMIGGWRKSLE